VEPLEAPARPPDADPGDPDAVAAGPLEIRPAEYQVLAHGRRVNLTVREFELFWALAERPDRVVRRSELYERVWGGPMAPRDRSVDVFVRKLRRKLALASPGWGYIHTHFGIGYRFTPEPPMGPDG
jgi:DNA-binding response OmpR family regulator